MIQTGEADATLDITRETCPMTYVRTRLALDRLASGQILDVRLKGTDPLANVRATARQQGHQVLGEVAGADGTTLLRLRRA